MNHPGKKRKHGMSIVPGPNNGGHPSNSDAAALRSSQISKALHTHTVCHWGIKRNGALTYHHSSIVVPPSAAFQVANVGLGCSWYASLFCQPTSIKKGLEQSVTDIDAPGTEAVMPAKRTRVSSPHY